MTVPPPAGPAPSTRPHAAAFLRARGTGATLSVAAFVAAFAAATFAPATFAPAAFAPAASAAPVLATAGPPGESEDAGPLLAIQIDNGGTATEAGDQLTYTTRIRNLGTADAEDLVITQTLPPGVRLKSADQDGRVDDGLVTWHVDLPAGRTSSFVTSLELAEPPPGQLRLAVVSCVRADGADRPTVCAADSDELPAGGAASGDGENGSDGLLASVGGVSTLLVLGGIALIASTLAVVSRRLLRRRRPTPTPQNGPTTQDGPTQPEIPAIPAQLRADAGALDETGATVEPSGRATP
ncbi:hypothetical protein, partial [Frankia sp. EI5c]|uniref:hypothetical protein n=1 Tax=Frankia sp. EI5c TaxID=683316 RepID=UPI0037BE7397